VKGRGTKCRASLFCPPPPSPSPIEGGGVFWKISNIFAKIFKIYSKPEDCREKISNFPLDSTMTKDSIIVKTSSENLPQHPSLPKRKIFVHSNMD